jgi:hypothetical protein
MTSPSSHFVVVVGTTFAEITMVIGAEKILERNGSGFAEQQVVAVTATGCHKKKIAKCDNGIF